jgi:hypothetical protein
MEEIWKEIDGFENYHVSNLGRVKSLKRSVKNRWSARIVRERILKPITSSRYPTVNLKANTYNRTKYIHKLVAIAFLGHKPNGVTLIVDHIDNNPLNNRLDNLQIITQAENLLKQDRYKHLSNDI